MNGEKHMQRLIIFALTALATALGVDATDPTLWFGETAALAVVVAAVIAYLRTAINLDGIRVVIVSVIVGAALGAAGFAAGLFAAGSTLVQAVAFGLGAGWLASGGVDFLRSVLRPKPEPAG